MSLVVDILSWACLLAGSAFCVIGAFGLVRMPELFTRFHAAGMIDTVGAGLILLGLILQAGFTLVAAKLVMIGLLIFFTSPTACHAMAKAALARGIKPLAREGE